MPGATQDEKRIFYAFVNFSVTSLSGHFTSPFWESRVLQLSMSESCVRNAVISIGALHEHFNQQPFSANTTRYSKPYTMALRYHARSIGELARHSANSQQWDLALTACILFVCFENFMGNYRASLTHLRAGLQILRRIHEAGTTLAYSWKREFSPLLMRLSIQSCLFLDPREDIQRAALWSEIQASVPGDPIISFNTIEDALWDLSAIAAAVIGDRGQHQVPPTQQTKEKRRTYLISWETKLKEYLSKANLHGSAIDRTVRGAAILKIFQILICITGELYEPSEDRFGEMLEYCESVDFGQLSYDQDTSQSFFNFSMDLGTIAPLFFVALKSNNAVTRLRAWKLLKRSPRREGLWDSEICARMIGNIIDVTTSASLERSWALDISSMSGDSMMKEEVLRPKNSIWVA
jgi:hypothetical protein